MEELVQLVARKTGLPPDAARDAVETMLAFAKQRLPAALAGRVDAMVASGQLARGVDELTRGLEALLGKPKQP